MCKTLAAHLQFCITRMLGVNFSYSTAFRTSELFFLRLKKEKRFSKCVNKIQTTDPEKELKKTTCSVPIKLSRNWFTHQHVWLIFTVPPRWSKLNKGQIKKKKKKIVWKPSLSHSSSVASKVCYFKLKSTLSSKLKPTLFRRTKGPGIGNSGIIYSHGQTCFEYHKAPKALLKPPHKHHSNLSIWIYLVCGKKVWFFACIIPLEDLILDFQLVM